MKKYEHVVAVAIDSEDLIFFIIQYFIALYLKCEIFISEAIQP